MELLIQSFRHLKKTAVFVCFLVTSNISAQDFRQKLTSALNEHQKQSGLPGFAVCVVDENGVLYERGFGYADIESKRPYTIKTIENVGSVSKTIVGLALVKAIQANYLSMDSEINDYLSFNVTNPYFPDSPILVKHLATHTSSILDTKNYGKSYVQSKERSDKTNVNQDFLNFISSHDMLSLADFLANILTKQGDWYKKKNFLKTAPGTQKEYANLNAALMALVIEKATGSSFIDYSQTEIFDPLQMTESGWSKNKNNLENIATLYFPNGQVVPNYSLITYPDGGLYSSVSDLNKYLCEVIKAYIGQSDFLELEAAKLLLPGDQDNNRAFWGIGEKSKNIGHSGSDPGVQSDLQFNATTKIGRIILSNVNAEDNEDLWGQYQEIHRIISKFEPYLAN
ncbi:MAG: serine hydrolase domain-containing protein [Flavobacteriaceae bacterium]